MKLYWRHKKADGKYTWSKANVCEYMTDDDGNIAYAYVAVPQTWDELRPPKEEQE